MLNINNNTYKSPNFKGLTIGSKTSKVLDKIGAMKSPGQRLAFGVAALALQPAIDKFNPWVDKETRDKSAVRSAAKAIACTVTGVLIREACILGTNAILNGKKIASKLPEYMTKNKNHSSAVIGTLMGLAIMTFTNFLIDVPLTNKLASVFSKKLGLETDNPDDTNNKKYKKQPPPSFKKDPKCNAAIHNIAQKINEGQLPPMSQVNMEVIKWAS